MFLLLIKIIMEWLYQVTAAAVVVVPWWDDLEELFDFFNEELLPCCWSCWTCSLFFNTAYTLSTWLSFSRRGMRSSNSRSSISSNQEEQGTWKMRVSQFSTLKFMFFKFKLFTKYDDDSLKIKTYCIVWMKHVWCWRVINNNDFV